MKIRIIYIGLLAIGCSGSKQNDLIELKDIGKTTKGTTIGYKLFQTGVDNYRYEFYSVDDNDTIDLFRTHLNDATYKGVRFLVQESEDTIKIKSSRNLGDFTKKVNDNIFILQKKIDPFVDLSFTVHGESGKMTQLMLYNDSISTLSELEISVHKKIWDNEEVDVIVRDLRNKDIKTFTFIVKYPSSNADYYLVKFGQINEEQLPAISYYRVDNKSGLVDKVAE